MKNRLHLVSLFLGCFLISNLAFAQVDTTATSNEVYIITTNDGGEFIGKILSQDTREVLIRTIDRGDISIPKYQIKEMKLLNESNISATGEYVADQAFATRYAFTTNALPMEKGKKYAHFSLFGPEFHYGATKNFNIGIMTSWLAVPVIASLKYSIRLGNKAHFGLGALLGTGSWTAPQFGLALPYGMLTFGDRRNNLNFSYGYGQVWNEGDAGGTQLYSIAAIFRMGNKISFVFDSFIVPISGQPDVAILLPGLRFQDKDNKAFQFSFGGVLVDGDAYPIPFVQWFRVF